MEIDKFDPNMTARPLAANFVSHKTAKKIRKKAIARMRSSSEE